MNATMGHSYRTFEIEGGETIYECTKCDASGLEPSRYPCDDATPEDIEAEVVDRRKEAQRGWYSVGT